MNARLIVGANRIDRVIENAENLLLRYRESGDIGYEYLKYQPTTPSNVLLPEDLAVTLLVNSRAGYRAFQSLRDHGKMLVLDALPVKSLEETTDSELKDVARIIATVAGWSGFGASLATKVLHKKRPTLIPVLDNQAIFGAYMNSNWPAQRSTQDSIKAQVMIEQGLTWIRYDLLRPENRDAWPLLQEVEPNYSLIEIFDSVWWMHFRDAEPVKNQVSA
jgi:Family of unknown function (DUF6308)